MSLVRILDIDAGFLRAVESGSATELSRNIESKLSGLDEQERLPYEKTELVELIKTIETRKMSCLRGDISAKQLYGSVTCALNQFKMRRPGFDYMKDTGIKAYYS